MRSEDEVRKINLIELLLEECELDGKSVPEPPEDAAKKWTEDEIRTYFESEGRLAPNNKKPSNALAAPPAEVFNLWFPGLKRSLTSCERPRLRVLCFPSSGNAEDMYTSEGSGTRRAPSPLLEWCRGHHAELLAVQYPGRVMRVKEEQYTDVRTLALAIGKIVGSRLTDVPYVIVGHSMGAWAAYEFMRWARESGAIPLPLKAFLSAMPGPNISEQDRPWRRQRDLNEEQFKEECRCWDINDVVFSSGMWEMYRPLLRADFRLFDEYQWSRDGGDTPIAPFDFPLTTFFGSRDQRVKEHHVELWRQFTRGPFSCSRVDGNHLWPLDKTSKVEWQEHIVKELEEMEVFS